jgi:hypothetical protein
LCVKFLQSPAFIETSLDVYRLSFPRDRAPIKWLGNISRLCMCCDSKSPSSLHRFLARDGHDSAQREGCLFLVRGRVRRCRALHPARILSILHTSHGVGHGLGRPGLLLLPDFYHPTEGAMVLPGNCISMSWTVSLLALDPEITSGFARSSCRRHWRRSFDVPH